MLARVRHHTHNLRPRFDQGPTRPHVFEVDALPNGTLPWPMHPRHSLVDDGDRHPPERVVISEGTTCGDRQTERPEVTRCHAAPARRVRRLLHFPIEKPPPSVNGDGHTSV